MRVISKKPLKEFGASTEGAGSRKELEIWMQVVAAADWASYADVKATFGARFDLVGDCAVFDICGNKFRLITRIRFKNHCVYVLRIMTHGEYDREDWKEDCGCFKKPPKKPKSPTRTPRGNRK